MLNAASTIAAANAYLPTLIDQWVNKELFGICDVEAAPKLGYLIAYLDALCTLNCTTLTVQQQQCLLQFVSPPNCGI